MHVGLLYNGRECLLGRAARLQERGKVAALPQLRDGKLDPACPGVPGALSVAVSMVHPLGASHAGRRAGQHVHLHRHQPLGRKGQHVAHEVGVGALFDQLDEGHSLVGHRHLRSRFSFANRTLNRRPAVTAEAAARALQRSGRRASRAAPSAPSYTTPRDWTQGAAAWVKACMQLSFHAFARNVSGSVKGAGGLPSITVAICS